MEVTNTMLIRKMNIEKVRSALLKNNGLTKNEICQATGLSLASCTNLLKILKESGEIKKIVDCESTGGRKAKRYFINEQYELVLTVILSKRFDEGFFAEYRLIDLSGNIIEAQNYQTNDKVNEYIIEVCTKFFKEHDNIKAIGLSVAGIISDDTIVNSGNDPFITYNLEEEFHELFQVPVMLENDVNIATLGYASQLGNEDESIALVDYYLGAGYYNRGRVITGKHHFAGEIAYFPTERIGKIFTSLGGKEHVEFLAKACIGFISLVDPDKVVLVGLKEEDYQYAIKYIKDRVPAKYLPELILVKSKEDLILKGIIQMTLSLLK